MKKAANIPGFNGWGSPDGRESNALYGVEFPVATGKPANTDGYFFLPSMTTYGAWGNGFLRYWIEEDLSNNYGYVFAVDPTPSPRVCIGAATKNFPFANFVQQ